ncbi:heavy-metal-associated domain-containing protein [Thiomicrospira microaerophila]|uniref:heavy-metal-associated domain-containing protein n=1 Tax=Thiomicrospira microaerophila TaxID=406020 RepID=UPI0005C93698|nr:heavy metal-associated domain-containing protein [Thiomicrospira microaerophila]
MQHTLYVENIKCGGCAHTILSKISALKGVSDVRVDVEKSTVDFVIQPPSLVEEVKYRLAKLGYPEKGSVDGLESVGAKAKSLVSCALGKIAKD